MTLLSWDKRLSVGPPSVDAQHKLLIESLNELHSAVMRGEGRNVVGLSLRTFLAYTRNHHTSEEALMAKVGYPDLSGHRALHRELLGTIEGHLARLERGEGAVTSEFLHFLRDWLSNHIEKFDRAYVPWILRYTTSQARAATGLAGAGFAQTSNESCEDENNGAGLVSEASS
ncbi:MAG TPA: bacteriohemerythrin [Terracidiphilus sp.]|jgi:hemerythrin-like metal-binding protein|nr:bacteriohemerythrin [Terracidiphilus sp.]